MKLAALLLGVMPLMAGEVDVARLVRQSVAASSRNWEEAPNYSYTVQEIEEKLDSKGQVRSRTQNTYEVMTLEGSEYRRLLKRDGHDLGIQEQQAEKRKFEQEAERRRTEPAQDRARRIARYERERKQDHAMMNEMAEAFEYRLAGEANIDGRACWILDATPKPGYQPKTRDTKVLTAMKGRMWLDKETAQWVKVEAEVIHPVSFYAVASVSPGTRFLLEQEPVGEGVWMPKHFAVRVNSSILMFSRNSQEDDRYSAYRRVAGESARPKGSTQQSARQAH